MTRLVRSPPRCGDRNLRCPHPLYNWLWSSACVIGPLRQAQSYGLARASRQAGASMAVNVTNETCVAQR